jgi:AcrR family transcriptional regulator
MEGLSRCSLGAETEATSSYDTEAASGLQALSLEETSVTIAKPMRADARRNYERLLHAGREVLSERGAEATMEEVARRADVGVGTLYRHFPRRFDLVEAVYREDVDTLVALAATVAEEQQPWPALEAWLHAFVLYAENKRVFLTELHEAFQKCPEIAQLSRERIIGALSDVLTRAQASGAARPDLSAEDLMQLVGGMCMARNASLAQNERLLTFVLDGIRSPS